MAIDFAKGLSDNPIIQVVSGTSTTQSSTTSSSFQTGFSLNITPHHTANKIIVMGTGMISMGGGSTMGGVLRILRSIVATGNQVNLSGTGSYGHCFTGATNYDMDIAGNGFIFLDDPSTTNQVTYIQEFRTEHHHVYYNQKKYANRPGKASFVLMEIMA